MKTSWMWSAFLGSVLLIAVRPAPVVARTLTGQDLTAPVAEDAGTAGRPTGYEELDLSGPRVGLMIAPGDASISRRLKEHGMGNLVSQFGWHFERQIVPLGGGPQLVTEIIPLIGGVEYGKFVPSVTAAVGVRLRSGLEFGTGPSLTIVSTGGDANMGLVIAVGKTLDYGDVCIPLNVAVSTNPKGTMVTLIAGYAINRAAR